MNNLLDWNYEMSPGDFNYYCQQMPDMEQMCQNFSKSNFFYDMNPNCMGLVRDVGRVLGGESHFVLDIFPHIVWTHILHCFRPVLSQFVGNYAKIAAGFTKIPWKSNFTLELLRNFP